MGVSASLVEVVVRVMRQVVWKCEVVFGLSNFVLLKEL